MIYPLGLVAVVWTNQWLLNSTRQSTILSKFLVRHLIWLLGKQALKRATYSEVPNKEASLLRFLILFHYTCKFSLCSLIKLILPQNQYRIFKKKIPAHSFIPVCSFMNFQKMTVCLFIPVCSLIRNFSVFTVRLCTEVTKLLEMIANSLFCVCFQAVSNIRLETTYYLNDLSFQPVFPYQSLGHSLSFCCTSVSMRLPGKNLSFITQHFLLERFGTYFPNCM